MPECLCLAIEDGSPKYLAWIAESVAAPLAGEAPTREE
jgi:hypothetical protein